MTCQACGQRKSRYVEHACDRDARMRRREQARRRSLEKRVKVAVVAIADLLDEIGKSQA